MGNPTPFVAANLDYSGEPELQALEDARRLRDAVILQAHGVKVGIFGLTTPTLPAISSPGAVVPETDLSGFAQTQIAVLTEAGAKIVIMQSHPQSDLDRR